MRVLAVVGLLLFGLGCAGIGEDLIEMATGGEFEITEDGMVMTTPEGATMRVVNGERAVPPEGFPLPEPWEGARAQALTTMTSPDGAESVMLSYDLDRPKDEVMATYRAWFEAQGITPEHRSEDKMGTHTESLMGTLPDGKEAGILISQAFGQDSLTILHGHDLEELQRR